MGNKKNISVYVKNRVAWSDWKGIIVCGNGDYTINFTFDEEWGEDTAKTAIFKYRTDKGMRHTKQPFTGNTVAVPKLYNIREVEVGVVFGDIATTTGATLRCVPSVRCGSGKAAEYEKERFDELMQLFNDLLHDHENLKTLAKFACVAADMEQDDGFTILPEYIGVDRATFWGNYLRYCSDGGVVKSVEEIEREGTKFLRLRFDMGPLVTNFDVPEFIDIPVSLITERVEESDGPGLVNNSTGLELDLGVGSGGAGGLTPEQAADLAANTEVRHKHENKELLDAFGFDESTGRVLVKGDGLLAESDVGERVASREQYDELSHIIDEGFTGVSQEVTGLGEIINSVVADITTRLDGIEGGIDEIEAMIDESGVLDE